MLDIRYLDNDVRDNRENNGKQVDGMVLPCFVTVTLDDRAYGGHEEGGWWYDTSDPIEHHYCATLAVYERVMDRIARQYDNEGRYPIDSVCCDGIYRVFVGQYIPERYPSRRPHYE